MGKKKVFTVLDAEEMSKHPQCDWDEALSLAKECGDDQNEDLYVLQVVGIYKRPTPKDRVFTRKFSPEELPLV
jgi:hypothetical protein